MAEITAKTDMTTQELILNHSQKKYELINCALRWSKEISKREDAPKGTQDLLDAALRDILTDKVTIKDILKLAPFKEIRKASKDGDRKGKYAKKRK
ncbi:MAG: hypothetical protein ABII23_05290 [bacterium]